MSSATHFRGTGRRVAWLAGALVVMGLTAGHGGAVAGRTGGIRPAAAALACDSVPALNRQVLAYVQTKLKKKVGTGECWDLAAEALKGAGATWDGQYVFGQPVDYRTACVFPGDVMQFEGVVIRYDKDGMRWQEEMRHHTAVIYAVQGPGVFTLAHQNFGPAGRKVGLTELDLAHIRKGKFTIFRPVR